jgi:cephalosporin hydroxylase
LESEEYLAKVENEVEFIKKRNGWRIDFSNDIEISEIAKGFIERATDLNYAYQWSWLGVPIIKYPEDMLVIQEFMFEFRPEFVIEIGVARGGGLKFYHSIQKLMGLTPKVLGIDIKFFPHTLSALESELLDGVELIEGNSVSPKVISKTSSLIRPTERTFLILDSNHSHDHVKAELESYSPLLPEESVILVADTLGEKIVDKSRKRNWGPGNNALSALKEFLFESQSWALDTNWSRRAAISESRDGWIRKVRSGL